MTQTFNPEAPKIEKPPAQAWRYYLSMIRFSPWIFLAITVMRIFIFGVASLLMGLLLKEFFDTLTGASPLAFTPLAIAAMMVVLAVVRAVVIFADIYAHYLYGFRTGALLRKNMLTRILERPGAQAVPQSPGEAISRFRDDVNTPSEFTSNIPFLIGQGLFAILALITMWRISPRVTLIAYIPFVLVILVAHSGVVYAFSNVLAEHYVYVVFVS